MVDESRHVSSVNDNVAITATQIIVIGAAHCARRKNSCYVKLRVCSARVTPGLNPFRTSQNQIS